MMECFTFVTMTSSEIQTQLVYNIVLVPAPIFLSQRAFERMFLPSKLFLDALEYTTTELLED